MKKKTKHIIFLTGVLACVPMDLSFAQVGTSLSSPATQRTPSTVASSQEQVINRLVPADLSASQIADILGWTTATNMCGGYYIEPEAILAYPNPPDIGVSQITITADRPVYISRSSSTLEGHVTVNQPGRQITADKAVIYRDLSTGKISKIVLLGDVHMREAGKLIVGNAAKLDLAKGTATIHQSIYHIVRPSTTGLLNAWGIAGRMYRDSKGVLNFFKASYSTCPPTGNAWLMRANHIKLDKQTGRGTAYNARLYAKGVPFLYLPYFNFPIDKRRYSGFLYPTFGFTNTAGGDLSLPYYLNLAPNYDATLTPRVMSKRGVQLSGLFRYLTQKSNGFLQVSFLPTDRAFEKFKQTAAQEYPPGPLTTPFLNRLQNDSDNRRLFAAQNNTIFNDKWSSALILNYVTDDYYFQDLGFNPAVVNTDQLLNDADLNYQSEHWRFLTRLQGYQTLHLINQAFVMDQYQRLPQLDLSADYPQEAYGLDYQFNSEYVNFQHNNDFFLGVPFPTGSRLHVDPGISLPIVSASGFITPQLQLDATGYSLSNNATLMPTVIGTQQVIIPNPADPKSNNIQRVLPIFDIDSGLYFERETHLFGRAYRQTLEPRVFYLYVPQSNQNDIPVFDTALPPFSFDELFRTNRFIGYDRIGDANQVSLGVTTRFLDDYTSEDKLDASIGEIYYLHKHSVCLYPNCSDDPTVGDQVSPIAGLLTYHLTPHWSANAAGAWDPNQSQVNNDSFYVQYTPAPQHVVNVGYTFVRDGDILNSTDLNSSENNLNRIDTSFAWPINNRWSALGDWNYNISHGHSQTYLYGLQYDSCCWAVRILGGRTLASEDVTGNTTYTNAYYIQFQLKGLGNLGNSDPGSLLMSIIPGYQDTFRG